VTRLRRQLADRLAAALTILKKRRRRHALVSVLTLKGVATVATSRIDVTLRGAQGVVLNAVTVARSVTVGAPTVQTSSGGGGFPTSASPLRQSITSTNSNRQPAAGTYSRVHFTNGLDLSSNTGGVYTFNDCLFTGTVVLGYISARTTRVFNYCEINGNQAGTEAVVGGGGFTMDHCKIWNGGQGISGQDYILTNCWIGDLYGSGDFHSEALLIIGDEVFVNNCTLLGNYLGTAPGFTGGMSSSVSVYTHGDFWQGHTNVTVQNSLLQSSNSTGTTVYWGTPPSQASGDALINCDIINNTFRRVTPGSGTSNPTGAPDIITHFPSGSSGNATTGNVYEDNGASISIGSN
jgi:hypothetical protein